MPHPGWRLARRTFGLVAQNPIDDFRSLQGAIESMRGHLVRMVR